MGHHFYANYNATEANAIELTRSMTPELATMIRVNAACQGFIMTHMLEADYMSETRRRSEDMVPMPGLSKPEDVATIFPSTSRTRRPS